MGTFISNLIFIPIYGSSLLASLWLYLQWNQQPKISKIGPTPTSYELLVLPR